MSDTVTAAEKNIIGAAFLDPESLRFAVNHVTPNDFTDARLGTVFNMLVAMRSLGNPITETTVAHALTQAGHKTAPHDLFALKEVTPTASNVDYLARIVADAAGKRRMGKLGHHLLAYSQSDMSFRDAMDLARDEWAQVKGEAATKLEAYTLDELLDGPDDYDWLIPNLIERKDRLVLTGGEGAGKSYLVQQIAILSAAGIHPTTFERINPVRVLVIDTENSAKQWRRRIRPLVGKAKREGVCNPSDNMSVVPTGRLNITDERDLGSVHALIDHHHPDMLVIGPLYKLTPKAIQTDDDAAPLITALDGLRDRGLALVMEAHMGKATDSTGNRNVAPRGSAALLGWPEFGFGLVLDKDTEGPDRIAELIRWRGDREERAWPVKIRRGGHWPWTDAAPALTAYKQDLINQRSAAA